ncbi:hypothetical protein DFJ74DRAFT_284977 [Hyaloraphidium curvatum]|nr:hypothetical protein DFJ74DRAFT_284977 [Hyaloraphidium curvatum]
MHGHRHRSSTSKSKPAGPRTALPCTRASATPRLPASRLGNARPTPPTAPGSRRFRPRTAPASSPEGWTSLAPAMRGAHPRAARAGRRLSGRASTLSLPTGSPSTRTSGGPRASGSVGSRCMCRSSEAPLMDACPAEGDLFDEDQIKKAQMSTVEKEQQGLLTWAPHARIRSRRLIAPPKSYMKDVARAAGTSYVYFADIVPKKFATAQTAANAFFYVLAMTTRDILDVWVVAGHVLLALTRLPQDPRRALRRHTNRDSRRVTIPSQSLFIGYHNGCLFLCYDVRIGMQRSASKCSLDVERNKGRRLDERLRCPHRTCRGECKRKRV